MTEEVNESRQIAEYWNRIAGSFDAIYSGSKSPLGRALDRYLRADMYQRFEWVMRKAGPMQGKTACDVGCGSGRFVVALAQRGADVTGVDFAPQMLDLARQLASQNGVAERCRFQLSDILDFRSDTRFDLVIAIGFWDYVADPLSRLQIIRNVTSGRFLSAWPRSGTIRAAIRKARLKVAGCPVYFWDLRQIEDLLRRSNFRMVGYETHGQLYCVEAIPE